MDTVKVVMPYAIRNSPVMQSTQDLHTNGMRAMRAHYSKVVVIMVAGILSMLFSTAAPAEWSRVFEVGGVVLWVLGTAYWAYPGLSLVDDHVEAWAALTTALKSPIIEELDKAFPNEIENFYIVSFHKMWSQGFLMVTEGLIYGAYWKKVCANANTEYSLTGNRLTLYFFLKPDAQYLEFIGLAKVMLGLANLPSNKPEEWAAMQEELSIHPHSIGLRTLVISLNWSLATLAVYAFKNLQQPGQSAEKLYDEAIAVIRDLFPASIPSLIKYTNISFLQKYREQLIWQGEESWDEYRAAILAVMGDNLEVAAFVLMVSIPATLHFEHGMMLPDYPGKLSGEGESLKVTPPWETEDDYLHFIVQNQRLFLGLKETGDVDGQQFEYASKPVVDDDSMD